MRIAAIEAGSALLLIPKSPACVSCLMNESCLDRYRALQPLIPRARAHHQPKLPAHDAPAAAALLARVAGRSAISGAGVEGSSISSVRERSSSVLAGIVGVSGSPGCVVVLVLSKRLKVGRRRLGAARR